MLLKTSSLTSLTITRVVCLSPIRIKNPNKGLRFIRGDPRYLKDRQSGYLNFPCGHCSECIAKRQMDLVQRIMMESMKNEMFFVTMTYNDETLPYLSVNDYTIRYADYQDVIHMFKRIKKRKLLPPFRYFGVSELGSRKGRPHFHLLLIFPKIQFQDYNDKIHFSLHLKDVLLANWCRNVGSTRAPSYIPLCTYAEKFINNKWRRNFDVSYCCPNASANGIADVAFYCLKYMLKPSDRESRLQQALKLNLDPDEYNDVWSIVRCRSFYSTGLGLAPLSEGKLKQQDIIPDPDIVKYLKDGVQLSIKSGMPYPCFYNPLNGTTFPLARYYCSKPYILSLSDQYEFYFTNNPDLSEPYFVRESLAYSELMAKLDSQARRIKLLHFTNDEYLEELCQSHLSTMETDLTPLVETLSVTVPNSSINSL